MASRRSTRLSSVLGTGSSKSPPLNESPLVGSKRKAAQRGKADQVDRDGGSESSTPKRKKTTKAVPSTITHPATAGMMGQSNSPANNVHTIAPRSVHDDTVKDPPTTKDFKIAVICALRVESDAVLAVFDKFWEDDEIVFEKAQNDHNSYTTGVIGRYNVVLIHMPNYGKIIAADVGGDLLRTFEEIKLVFVVGICGGMPNEINGKDIWLGDVIISTGLVEYDLGKLFASGFIPNNPQGSEPKSDIKSFLVQMEGIGDLGRLKDNTATILAAPPKIECFEKARYLGLDEDRLFESNYPHEHRPLRTCKECKSRSFCVRAVKTSCEDLKCTKVKRSRQVQTNNGPAMGQDEARKAAEPPMPDIHYGLVASGSMVLKSAEDRDKFAASQKVIAFEMEGAGVWERYSCVIIKGVCDYADSHKNKKWQGYAASTAAACMKAFLERWRPTVEVTPNAGSRASHSNVQGPNAQYVEGSHNVVQARDAFFQGPNAHFSQNSSASTNRRGT